MIVIELLFIIIVKSTGRVLFSFKAQPEQMFPVLLSHECHHTFSECPGIQQYLSASQKHTAEEIHFTH